MASSRPRRACRLRSRILGVVAAIIVGALMLLGLPATAVAQNIDGLRVSSSTIYTPDPAQERIAVESTYTMTNEKPDEILGGSVRAFHYTKWLIAMPASVTDFVATSSGTTLATSIEADPDAPDIVFGTINLPFNLNYQETVTLTVRYTIPGGTPRADSTVARVNNSFLSFSVWAAGDPGLTDVRILVPDGFSVNLQGDLHELREVERDGATVLEALAIAEPQKFFGQVFGRNDNGLIIETAELPDAVATVRAWPDDPDWAEFVVGAIERDVPVIETLTGMDWPAGNIEVIETVTPYLFGYGGWFNASSGVIEVGEYLERDLILHELGHAWFNDELIAGRWITEGLAEEFASRVIEETGSERPDPDKPDLDDPIRVPLAEWASPWTLDEEDAFVYEQYHYNASWWVMRQITDQIGLEEFSAVLIALQNDSLPYSGDGPIEQVAINTSWFHLYDLLEIEADIQGLDELFRTYVLAPADQRLLDRRIEARVGYASLVAAGRDWAPPLEVRRHMSSWRFGRAENRMQAAFEVLGTRDHADELAADLGVSIEHRAELRYETASSPEALLRALNDEQQLVDDLHALQVERRVLGDQATALGAALVFDSLTYDQAVLDVEDQRLAITNLADLRNQVQESASSLGLEPPARLASVTATDFGAEASQAQAQLATLEAIAMATITVQAPQNLRQRIGLWGTDPAAVIDDARASFESNDLADAIAQSARADAIVTAATSTGASRIMWAAMITIALGTLGVIVIRTRRHSVWGR